MSDKQLLEKIGEMIVANNSTLLDAVDEKIKISEKRVITQLEKKVEISQQDTIEVLSSMIHTGYDLHEVRLQRIEDELVLPPPKQKH